MKSGSISFSRLFDYIELHREIPHKDEQSFAGFKEIYLQLVKNIDDIPGWNIWVKSVDDLQSIIYFGQSQLRKTVGLQARIKEEFLDEFVALWATVWNSAETVSTLDHKYAGKYTSQIKRSAQKDGATHIVWFGRQSLSDQQLNNIEHAMITKYKPPANKQSRRFAESNPELLADAEKSLQFELPKLQK